MRRNDVVAAAQAWLRARDIPGHLCSIKTITSRIEVEILIGSQRKRVELPTGITQRELTEKLADLETFCGVGGQQVDLEEAITHARRRPRYRAILRKPRSRQPNKP